jgi:DNA-binding response OmpR family regulator
MTNPETHLDVSGRGADTLLLVAKEVLLRTPIAEYLRSCGFRVLEARDSDEAFAILQQSTQSIDVIFSQAEHGFALARWVRMHRPSIKVILTGTAERAAQAAADLCESGPMAKRPYDPQLLLQEIKASLAKGED